MNKYLSAIFIVGILPATFFIEMLHFSVNTVTATPTTSVETCSTQKINEILAPASASASTVDIDCHLNLNSSDVITPITKRMIFEVSGVNVNCNFATLNGGEGTINYRKDMIEVRSIKTGARTWKRPENITIKNCNIIGSVRVWGMAINGEGADLRDSSKEPGHATNARNNAPTRITFDNLTITGVGRSPLYFAPGVTYSKLINSEIKGIAESVAVYLDAESSQNIIKNNYIHMVSSEGREVMAIDGSSYNTIIDNSFSELNHGGIYLYRNCGEGGTTRHSTPSYNTIVNNIFVYYQYIGDKPSVYLGARDGKTAKGEHNDHCPLDKDSPYGSSVDDRDFARYNIVMQNQFYKKPFPFREAVIADYIKSKNWENNSPNYIDYNEIVPANMETQRLAGCYVPSGYKDFVLHGQMIDVFRGQNAEPTCVKPLSPGPHYLRHSCNDGDLLLSIISSCKVSKPSFDCQVSGNNGGCRKEAICPSGQKIVGAKAACNLESGTISDSMLETVPAYNIKVIKASDPVSAGSCYVGSTSLKSEQKPISGIYDLDRVLVGCKEHDANGGDCHIKGILYCR